MQAALCSCGVLAVGRCADCGSAFCASHKFGESRSLCLVCLQARSDQESKLRQSRDESRRRAAEQIDENRRRIALAVMERFAERSGEARARYHRFRTPARFLRPSRTVQCQLETGWYVGEFEWTYKEIVRTEPTFALRDGRIVPGGEAREENVELVDCGDHQFQDLGFPLPPDRDPSLAKRPGRLYATTAAEILGKIADDLERS